jgi:hypothetical protein
VNSAARGALPVLEPFYYLKNFELVLATMHARYADLLDPVELRFINELPRMPRGSRALLARMVMRRGDLFKASRLKYAEIGDARTAAAPLVAAGWVTDRPMLRIDELQRILTKRELAVCLRIPRRYAAWRKPDLVAMLAARFSEPRTFADWCPSADDCVYALAVGPICERFRLMFFGNHRQDWSEFVTADLKIFNYEKVERTLQSRPFQTRAQIESFRRLQHCSDLFRGGLPLDELLRIVPPVIEDSGWLEDRRQRLLFHIAREYERAGDSATALRMYLNCTHRGARTRAIRLKSRARDWEAARALCLAAQKSPESEAELQYIRRILPRAHRKLGIACDAGYAPPVIPEFEILLDAAPAGAVEYRVRDHLARLADGTTVRYVENGLINSLFGLLCWPAIFAPVPGAFFHDFHRGPADLASGNFFRRRQREFQECLALLECGRHGQAIWNTFDRKRGIQSPFVRWQTLDRTLLRWALDCLPAGHLRLWFEWIVRDVKENRSGFPDLVQFWPAERKYRMIEVKGPGDRVQDNQRRLLEYCASHQMPVAVCHVRWKVGDPSPSA